LAAKSGVSETTIRAFENGDRIPSKDKVEAIELALKLAGVEFVAEKDRGPFIRTRVV
jgi:transcriptional regulator with XRE-family HTH domain